MSEALSIVYTTTAPSLVGVWVLDPTDPDNTERNYIHADGRSLGVKPGASVLDVAGRVNPIVEYGESTRVVLKVTVFAPFGPAHDADVNWWIDAVQNRRTILYRDNRGRLIYGALADGVEVADGRVGTALAVNITRVSFDEDVT